MTRPPRTARLAAGLGLLAAGALAARGDDDPLDALARGLVERRAAVERLSTQVEAEKTAQRDALRSLAQQRADVERQVKALELELEEARRAGAERRAEVERQEAARAALAPLVRARLDALAAWVQEALPFEVAGRAEALAALRRDLDAGRLPADEALARLWSALEDELRLTRECALHRQRLEVEGQVQLAEVVRLGMVLLYFRTPDGRVGAARREGAGWRFAVATDPVDQARLAALFEAFGKRIRQGFFELPLPQAGEAPAAGEAP